MTGSRPSHLAWLLLLPVVVAGGATLVAGSHTAAARAAQIDVTGIYQRDCAYCHGDDGAGTARGPSLRAAGPALTDYMLSTGRMPIDDPDDSLERSRPAYPPAVVEALVDYVDGLAGGGGEPIPDVDPGRGDVAVGGDLFRLQCAPCHQWSGGGGALLYGPAPGLGPSTPVQVGEAVRTGPGTMPAFSEAVISDRELDSIAAYVEYLDDPRDRGGWGLGHLGPLPEGFVAWLVGVGALLLFTHRIGEQRR